MHRPIALLIAVTAACTSKPPPPLTQPPPPENPELVGMIAAIDGALKERPDDGVLLLLRVAPTVELGRLDEAMTFLERLDAVQWDVPFAATDFGPLRERPRFQEIAESIAARSPLTRGSQLAFEIPEGADMIPEGIAVDPATGTFYVGSIRKRTIVAIDRDHKVSTFVAPQRDGLLSVLGMKVDPRRGVLWATSFASEGMAGFTDADRGRSELTAFALADGSVKWRIGFPPSAEPHLLNDLAIANDGTVYVTDSIAGAVWQVAPEGDVFESVVPPGTFAYPNGIVLAWNDNLLVAHGTGIAVVDPGTGKFERMPGAHGRPLGGIDGLLIRDRTLYAVQNGLGQPRIVAITLDETGTKSTWLTVLENDPATLEIPTTSALFEGALYTIANSQLDAIGPEGLRADRPLRDPRIVRTPVP